MSLYDDLPPIAPPPAAEAQNAEKPKKKRASFADTAPDTPIVVLSMMDTSPKSTLEKDSKQPLGTGGAGEGLFGDLPPPSTASSSLYGDLPAASTTFIKAASTSSLTDNFSKHRGLAAALGNEEHTQKLSKAQTASEADSTDAAVVDSGEQHPLDEGAKMELFVKKLVGVFTSCADLKKAAKACFILRDFIEKSVDSPAVSASIVPVTNALFNAHSRFSDEKWLPSLCSVLEALQTKKAHFDPSSSALIDLWTCAGCVVSRLNTSDDSFVVSKDLKFAQTLAEAIDAEETLLGRTRRWACMAVAEAAFKRFRLQWMRTPIDMFFKVLRERRQHFDGPARTRIESMLDTMKARSLHSGTISARDLSLAKQSMI